jgi:4,5:9,10-diseco-3-hydroxy-5,9,17-trioxoandrosta-1(10),2-diene-4-oate hydrolase
MLTYESTSRFVDVNGTSIHYHEAGQGPVLLVIHGGAPGAFGWGNFGRNLEALAQNFRTLIVDMPGYGKSDKPVIEGNRHAFCADLFHGMLGALKIEKAHVLGMATGGAVAAIMAIEYPEAVDQLILVSSAGGPSIFQVKSQKSASQVYLGGEGPTVEKMRDYLEQLVYNPALITDEVVNERYQASIAEDFIKQAPEGRPNVRKATPDLWKRLDLIKAKTLILWGRENRAQNYENAIFMLKMIPNSQVHIFGQCGLWVPYEKAAEFNELVTRFLAK